MGIGFLFTQWETETGGSCQAGSNLCPLSQFTVPATTFLLIWKTANSQNISIGIGNTLSLWVEILILASRRCTSL